jgi:hypothetical protein
MPNPFWREQHEHEQKSEEKLETKLLHELLHTLKEIRMSLENFNTSVMKLNTAVDTLIAAEAAAAAGSVPQATVDAQFDAAAASVDQVTAKVTAATPVPPAVG